MADYKEITLGEIVANVQKAADRAQSCGSVDIHGSRFTFKEIEETRNLVAGIAARRAEQQQDSDKS